MARAKTVKRGPSARLVAKVVASAVVGTLLAFGVAQLRRYATTSDRFAVQGVRVSGHDRADAETLVRLSGVETGENIFELDLDEVRRAVRSHPWVVEVEVERRLPRTVKIEVTEHEPRVLVALGHLYYANAQGEIVKRYAPGEDEVFTVVTGLSRDAVEAGDGNAQAMLRSAVELLDALDATLGEDAPEVAEINVDPAMGLSLVPSGDGPTVQLGHPPWGEGLSKMATALEALEARGVRASRLTIGGARRPERAVARLSRGDAEAGED